MAHICIPWRDTWTYAYLHTHAVNMLQTVGGKTGGDSHTAHKSKNSYCVIVISNIIFLTTNIITITTLPPHMYPISRIISSLPMAPGVPSSSSADVCVVTPVNSQPNDPPLRSLPQPLPPTLILGRWLCCARFTVATVGWCFRSHYSGPLMTLK